MFALHMYLPSLSLERAQDAKSGDPVLGAAVSKELACPVSPSGSVGTSTALQTQCLFAFPRSKGEVSERGILGFVFVCGQE